MRALAASAARHAAPRASSRGLGAARGAGRPSGGSHRGVPSIGQAGLLPRARPTSPARLSRRLPARSPARASSEPSPSDPPPPAGFRRLPEDEAGAPGSDPARVEVPPSAQSDYRKVEDPEWLEQQLLRADDGYPTSRAAVMRQALATGDAKGFGYAVSSVNLTLALLAAAYVSLAASRVGAEEGTAIAALGAPWRWLLLAGVGSGGLEVTKFVESVVGVEGRRKM